MSDTSKNIWQRSTSAIANAVQRLTGRHSQPTTDEASEIVRPSRKFRLAPLLFGLGLAVSAYYVYQHPPVQKITRGEIGLRFNQWTGQHSQFGEGIALLIPGVHEMRTFSLRDQYYQAGKVRNGNEAPFQSVEGLSLGVDIGVRYLLDQNKLAQSAAKLPNNISRDLVEPAVHGVIYKVFSRYTVREIFSSKRAEISQLIEAELKPKFAQEGLILRSVSLGKVDLPADYKAGMERLLAEELASEKMRYTLELKEKMVQQTRLEAEAEGVRREKAAEAAARESIIAAKAQEEAMKHVLPFKQKQIEQRGYEADAEKAARIKTSEGAAQARIIEATGEADSRRKLADAEAYRQDLVGKIASAQMERDGALISKHPLLIQKTMADKLSDKISVIIAPTPSDGGFIGAALLGGAQKSANAKLPASDIPVPAESEVADNSGDAASHQ